MAIHLPRSPYALPGGGGSVESGGRSGAPPGVVTMPAAPAVAPAFDWTGALVIAGFLAALLFLGRKRR